MAVIKQVNFFLVILLILGLVAFGGITLFYQDRIISLGEKYVNAQNSYNQCALDLNVTKTELEQAKQNLELNLNDVNKTIQLFESSQETIRELENKLLDKDKEISDLEGVIAEKEKEKADLRVIIGEKDAEIARLQEIISGLRDEIADLEDELDACQG